MSDKQHTLKLEELPEFIFGAEGDEGDQNGGDSADDANIDTSNTADAGSDSDEDDEEIEDDDPAKGLKSALAKERRAAKVEKRRADTLQREKDERELATKSEVEQARIREQKATEKLTKLAEGFKRSALENAIRAAAGDFIDVEDAVAGVDRRSITVEQDKDDPSDVTVDTKSVEKAVKALAAQKSHYLKTGTNDGEPTGGQFGGSKRKQGTPDEVYKDRYPSLR